MQRARSIAALAVLIICTASGSLRTQASQQTSRTTTSLTKFAWPVPCQVRVTQDGTKKGKRATMTFVVQLRRDKDPKHLLVSLRDFEFTKINDSVTRYDSESFASQVTTTTLSRNASQDS